MSAQHIAGSLATVDGRRNLREVLTPEGIPLRFVLGSRGDRAAAFLIDFLIQIAAILVVVLVGRVFEEALEGAMGALVLVAVFLVRNFYFLWFELRWQGTTPGKRKTRLRVIDRRGGPLSSDAIIVRNLMRELEIWQPLTVLILMLAGEEARAGGYLPGASGWGYLIAGTWLFIGAFLPLFNKDNLRLGDLVGGTMVVERGSRSLLQDMSAIQGAGGAKADAAYHFTKAQLELYGIYELQVLENLLRRDPDDVMHAYEVVCDKIKGKIGWPRNQWEVRPERFLRDFYAAQRGRLEHQLLFGKRRERKAR